MIRLFAALVITIATTAGCTAPAATPAPTPADTNIAEVTGTVAPGAVVSLLPTGIQLPMPEGPAVMDQYAKQFVPDTLYVRVGQPVEFRNTDALGHNVNVHRRGTGATMFDVETDPQQKYVHTFDRVGQYDVTCNEHPGMQATLVAADGPLATMSDDRGQFVLSGVPPGAYRLLVTFEGRTVAQAVTVTGPRTEVRVAP